MRAELPLFESLGRGAKGGVGGERLLQRERKRERERERCLHTCMEMGRAQEGGREHLGGARGLVKRMGERIGSGGVGEGGPRSGRAAVVGWRGGDRAGPIRLV